MSVEWSDAEREAVAYRLVHHYRVSPPAGDCSCGHVVPLGHSFAAHQADEALNALSDLVAAREAQAAAKALREAADGLVEGLEYLPDTEDGLSYRNCSQIDADELRERADRIDHDARCRRPKCPGGSLCCCQGGSMSDDATEVRLAIEGTWLVRHVDEHTCGTGRGGHYGAHEPGCGTIPEVDLSTLEGWDGLVAARATR